MAFTIYSYSKEIHITADKLEIDRDKNISKFSGNVYVLETGMEIWAEKLIVRYNKDKNEVEELYVENDVKVVRENITAKSQKGYYYPLLDEVKMYESVEVNENKNFIKCDELFLDIKNSISIMRGNSKDRVQALIINEE